MPCATSTGKFGNEDIRASSYMEGLNTLSFSPLPYTSMEYILAEYFSQRTRDTVQSGVSYFASLTRGITSVVHCVRFASAPAITFAAINGASLASLMLCRAVKVRILLDGKRQCVFDATTGYLRSCFE